MNPEGPRRVHTILVAISANDVPGSVHDENLDPEGLLEVLDIQYDSPLTITAADPNYGQIRDARAMHRDRRFCKSVDRWYAEYKGVHMPTRDRLISLTIEE